MTSAEGASSPSEIGRARDAHEPSPRPRAWVLLDARRAFLAVRARPLAGLTLALMLALSLAPPLVFVSRVDTTEVLMREMKKSGRMEQVPPEQLEQMREVGGKAMAVMLPVGAVGKRAGWVFVVTALIFMLLRGARPELRFSSVLGAVALGCAPLALHDLITALTFLIKDPLSLPDTQNVVLSNPAAWLLKDSGQSVVGALLKGLDFFELWSCALIALGVGVVAKAKGIVPWAASFGLHAVTVGFSLIGPAFSSGG